MNYLAIMYKSTHELHVYYYHVLYKSTHELCDYHL